MRQVQEPRAVRRRPAGFVPAAARPLDEMGEGMLLADVIGGDQYAAGAARGSSTRLRGKQATAASAPSSGTPSMLLKFISGTVINDTRKALRALLPTLLSTLPKMPLISTLEPGALFCQVWMFPQNPAGIYISKLRLTANPAGFAADCFLGCS